MTIDSYGELYVCDYNYIGTGSNEVDGFYLTSSGYSYDYTWSAQGQLENPTGVKIDVNGNLVVADGETGYVYNLFWNDDSILNQTSGGPGYKPTDIALDANGNIYVSSYAPCIPPPDGGCGDNIPFILEYNNNYSFTYSFNGSNWPIPLTDPQSIAVDSAGNLYVSDIYRDEIDYCTAKGVYLGAIIGFQPDYLTLDNAGDLFVSDDGDEILEYIK